MKCADSASPTAFSLHSLREKAIAYLTQHPFAFRLPGERPAETASLLREVQILQVALELQHEELLAEREVSRSTARALEQAQKELQAPSSLLQMAFDAAPHGASSGITRKRAQKQPEAFDMQLESQVAGRLTQLQPSKALLEAVLNASPIGIAVLDPLRNQAGEVVDFTCRLANSVMEAIAGRKLVGLCYRELYLAAKETGILAAFKQVQETGSPLDVEQQYEGERFAHWFRITAVKLQDGLVATVEDITGRKQGEDAIKDQAHFIGKVTATVPDIISVIEMATGNVEYINRETLPASGFSHEELTRLPQEGLLKLIHPDDQAAVKAYFLSFASAPDEEVNTLEYRAKDHSAEWEWFQVRGKVFRRNESGVATHCINVVQNVTHHKQLAQENLRMRLDQQQALLIAILEAQEEERRRISESLHNGVGQLLYATKLNLVRVDATALSEHKPEAVQALKKASELLSEAIVETRRVSHELVPILLKDYGLQKAMKEFCSRFAGTGIHLECHCFPERLSPSVEMALYRIGQELLNNIVKHAGATRARLEVYRTKDCVYMEAQDNGKGMITDADRLANKPFRRKGQGIGLPAIQDRVALLGGTLEIDSTAGKGTLITIRLPLSKIQQSLPEQR